MSESHRQIDTTSIVLPDPNDYESDLSFKRQKRGTSFHYKILVKMIGIIIILIGVFYLFLYFEQHKSETKIIKNNIDRLSKQFETFAKKQQNLYILNQNRSSISRIQTPSIQNRLPATGILGANSKIIQKGGIIKQSKGTVCQIDFLKRDQQGRSIQDVLYSKELIKKRIDFYNRRKEVVDNKKAQLPELGLSKYNLKLNPQALEEDKKLHQAQYERVSKIHSFDQYDTELPFCILVPGYNNNDKFRLESNLNSIFSQNYTNYFVVILDDASTDKSNEVFANYLNFYDINPHRYFYNKNQRRLTALQNIYYAAHNICSEDSITMIMDGDDELIGKNALKIFNIGYQKNKAGVVYSNFYFYNQDSGSATLGFTSSYTNQQKQHNRYRQISPGKYSQLRSVRTSIFRKIEAKDLQEQNGSFYKVDYDLAIFIPSMELSCTKVFKVDGVHYLYNVNTGINDFAVNNKEGARIEVRIRASKTYTCDKNFEEFINKN